MPVIETETITRRKIVPGADAFRNNSWLEILLFDIDPVQVMILDKAVDGLWFTAPELRELAALCTEMADILEKGE